MHLSRLGGKLVILSIARVLLRHVAVVSSFVVYLCLPCLLKVAAGGLSHWGGVRFSCRYLSFRFGIVSRLQHTRPDPDEVAWIDSTWPFCVAA